MDLDEEERDAIALSLSLGADLLLIDEHKGADAARAGGLECTGTLGALIMAAKRQWIDLAKAFAQLRKTSSYCSDDLMKQLLEQHGGALKLQ